MNRDTAVELLNNLLERAQEASEKTFLTPREIIALGIVLERNEPTVAVPKTLLRPVTVPISEIAPKVMLCIDFGTSFSKAFASVDTGRDIPEIIDLPLGAGGNGRQSLITPSEMIIEGDVIHFGVHARKVFDDTEAAPERLIDSIKQYMTLGADVSNLARIRMDAEKDPKQKFSQRDILLLYLPI